MVLLRMPKLCLHTTCLQNAKLHNFLMMHICRDICKSQHIGSSGHRAWGSFSRIEEIKSHPLRFHDGITLKHILSRRIPPFEIFPFRKWPPEKQMCEQEQYFLHLPRLFQPSPAHVESSSEVRQKDWIAVENVQKNVSPPKYLQEGQSSFSCLPQWTTFEGILWPLPSSCSPAYKLPATQLSIYCEDYVLSTEGDIHRFPSHNRLGNNRDRFGDSGEQDWRLYGV